MSPNWPDNPLEALLTHHLEVIKAPIPYHLSSLLAELHMLSRCADLLVDLVRWRQQQPLPATLYEQVLALQQQQDLPPLELQWRLVQLLQPLLPA